MALSDIQDLPNPGRDPNLLTTWRNFKKIREYAATPIGPTDGGTGLSSYTTGDMIYASATNVLSRLGIGSSGQFLRVVAGVPAWGTLLDADIPSALTGKTYNALTLTAQAVGFTIAGGTSSRTLTVAGTASVSGTNTGDQTITLTGDVTGSGTGSFAATIANNAVTLAKFQQIATSSILGRSTASTGNVEVLSASTTRTVLGLNTGDSPTFTAITLSGLAGTGTRLVTATSAGVLGNATTIAGDYTLSGNQAIGGTLGVTGVSKFGTGALTFATKNVSIVGASFDGTALQFENTDVDTVAHGRAFNFGITDVSSTVGRLDLTLPGVLTVLSVFSNGNVGIGSTTDGGQQLQVAGTSRFAGAATFASTITTPLTASLPVFTNGSSQLTTNAITGTGSVMMSASPTTTGTFTGAAANFSGPVSTGALTATRGTFTIPDNTTNAFSAFQGSDGYLSINTGNGAETIILGNTTITALTVAIQSGTGGLELVSTGDILTSGYVKFGQSIRLDGYIAAGALSTSAGSPTTITSTGHNSYSFNTNNGAAGYCNISDPDSGRIMCIRNRSSQQLYVMNGGTEVNPLLNGFNALLIGNGSTWDVFSSGT